MVDRRDDVALRMLTEKVLRERGFGCANYKERCLRRRIAVRMRARGVHTYEDYARVLDRDARAKADGRDHRVAVPSDGKVSNLHAQRRHGRRKIRVRASTVAKRRRASPRSVSTIPRTRKPPRASASWNWSNSRSWVSRSK